MNTNFPSREDIKKKTSDNNLNYQERLIKSIQNVDIDNLDFENSDYSIKNGVTEKQKVYFWIRLYLSKEDDFEPNDDIIIKYNYSSSGEELSTKFICYAKLGAENSAETVVDELVGYTPEDNKKVLCLMVDSERIDKDSDDIPFIRSLFRISRYYEYQLMRRDNLTFINKRTGNVLEYYDVDF